MNAGQESKTIAAVVGGGPAGLTAAIALAGAGLETVLLARRAPPDNRTTALLASSVTALDTLGVWARCKDFASPLRVMRIVDATRRLVRAPEVRFAADEIGLEAFAYNIENRHLMAALDARASELPSLRRVDADASSLTIGEDKVAIATAGTDVLEAEVVIGSDGRRSICREAAGIETVSRRYPQIALTFNLSHARPHHGISTEFHTEAGPFTLVPLPSLRSSLVCVVSAEEAEILSALDDDALGHELEQRAHAILGKIMVEPGRGAFPLAVETARSFARTRIALIGEAAHVLPPIGAQGLNLGLRDAAAIAELLVAAHRKGEDIGGTQVLSRYDAERRADVASRTLAVDLLNRSLLTDFLPLQGARGLGLYLMDRIGPLRRAVMREGVTPRAAQPCLMRGESL